MRTLIQLFRTLGIGALLPCFLGLAVTCASAQDASVSDDIGTTLALHPSLDFTGWRGDGALGYHFNDGNSNVSLFNFDIRYERRSAASLVRLNGDTSYGKDDGKTNVNRSGLLAQYQYLFSDLWYAGFGGRLNQDDLAEVTYRVRLNPAIGYYVVRNDHLRASFEIGPSYVFEEVLNREDSYLAPRVGQRVEWIVSPTSKFYEEVEFLLDATDPNNNLVEIEIGIDVAVTTDWSMRVSGKGIWDGEPAAGKRERDAMLITSLVYKLQSASTSSAR